MLLQLFVPGLITLNVVSRSAGMTVREKGKRWQEALTLMLQMICILLTPKVPSHNAAMSTCQKGKQWQRAAFDSGSSPAVGS